MVGQPFFPVGCISVKIQPQMVGQRFRVRSLQLIGKRRPYHQVLNEMRPLRLAGSIAAKTHGGKREDRHVGALWEMHDHDAQAIRKGEDRRLRA
jgi:hypothetical protein